MKFRYKVKTKYEDIFYTGLKKYKVIIQQYNPYSRLFKWDTKCDEYLEEFVFELKEDIDLLCGTKTNQVYQGLQNYKSMDEAVMKYITDIIIPRDKNISEKDRQDEWIKDFVLTKGWKTIEINKEDK